MRRGVSLKYLYLTEDMYENVVINARICGGIIDDFPITIGLHQGSALSPFFFTLMIDEPTRHIQDDISLCILFVDDIVIVDEIRNSERKVKIMERYVRLQRP